MDKETDQRVAEPSTRNRSYKKDRKISLWNSEHLTFLFISFSEQNLRDKNWGIISQAATDEGEFLPRFCVVSHKIRDIV